MRLYNGAPDDELAAIWKERDDAKAEAAANGLWITYFPAERAWMASINLVAVTEDNPHRMMSEFHSTPRGALNEALARQKQETNS